MKIRAMHDFFGELIGTFILVFFGCGAIAVTVLFSSHVGLFQIAIIWGFAVSLAIYTARYLSGAHINPAISLAMALAKRMSVRKLFVYWIAQFLGSFLAAVAVYCMFSSSIAQYEALYGIIRGTPESVKTAIMFCEFYPNPSIKETFTVSTFEAFTIEAIGTFFLVFLVFSLTDGCNVSRPGECLSPLIIGMAVTTIVCVIAPLTQAGINPARDLSPRIFAYLAGWKEAAFPDRYFGFLIVYVLGPFVGAMIATFIFKQFVRPLMLSKQKDGL